MNPPKPKPKVPRLEIVSESQPVVVKQAPKPTVQKKEPVRKAPKQSVAAPVPEPEPEVAPVVQETVKRPPAIPELPSSFSDIYPSV